MYISIINVSFAAAFLIQSFHTDNFSGYHILLPLKCSINLSLNLLGTGLLYLLDIMIVVWNAGLTCSLISRAPGVKQFLLTSFLYTFFILSNQTLKTTIINAQCKIYINMWCYSPWGSWNKAAGEPCISYYNAFHTTICREPQQPCFMTNFFITFLYTLFYCLFKNNHFGDFEQVIVKIVVLPILNKS